MGDCAAVQYSGAGGRDSFSFLAAEFIPLIQEQIKPLLEGRELSSFQELAREIDQLILPMTGKILHTAIRYGVTQALLDAVAKANHSLMVDLITKEYATKPAFKPIPSLASQVINDI